MQCQLVPPPQITDRHGVSTRLIKCVDVPTSGGVVVEMIRDGDLRSELFQNHVKHILSKSNTN